MGNTAFQAHTIDMSRRSERNRKASRKLKVLLSARLQRALSGKSGAWFLEPSGDLHEMEPRECLKSARVLDEVRVQSIEDNNDEFERDRVGF